MQLTRREALLLGAGGAVMALSPALAPNAALAAADVQAAIDAFTGGAAVAESGVNLTTPEIAENGNTVPVEVDAEGASSILIVADGNPTPKVATFHFGALAAASAASTRIRLAKTQNVIAVAKLADGSFARAAREVKVTIGGCGG